MIAEIDGEAGVATGNLGTRSETSAIGDVAAAVTGIGEAASAAEAEAERDGARGRGIVTAAPRENSIAGA